MQYRLSSPVLAFALAVLFVLLALASKSFANERRLSFGELDGAIARHAMAAGVPVDLAMRVVKRESGGNPRAVSKGNYGLMQIRLGTAQAMGYRGNAQGLLDAETNMAYAMKYLAGAYRAAGGNHDNAIKHYSRGYYYEAKKQGFSPYEAPTAARENPNRFAWMTGVLRGNDDDDDAPKKRGGNPSQNN